MTGYDSARIGRELAERALAPLMHPRCRATEHIITGADLAAIADLRDVAARALRFISPDGVPLTGLAADMAAAIHTITMMLEGEVTP